MLGVKRPITGFLVFQFVFYVLLGGLGVAGDSKDCDTGQGVSTISGNYIIPEGWVSVCECEGYTPKIYTSSEMAARNNYVTL